MQHVLGPHAQSCPHLPYQDTTAEACPLDINLQLAAASLVPMYAWQGAQIQVCHGLGGMLQMGFAANIAKSAGSPSPSPGAQC